MDESEFRAGVLLKVRKPGQRPSPEALDEAVSFFAELGPLQKHDQSECLRLATRFEAFRRKMESAVKASNAVDLPQTPGSLMAGDHVLRNIQPWVTSVREGAAHSTLPPCASLADVVRWCLNVEPEWLLREWRQQAGEHDSVKSKYLREDLTGILEHVRWLTEGQGISAWDSYILLNGEAPPLALLEFETREMARATGFSQVDLATYVLAGLPPLLPAGRIYGHSLSKSFSTCGSIHRRYVVVELYSADVSYLDFRELFRKVRGGLGATKKKPFSGDDQRFLGLVERLGGPPPGKGKKAFWEKVRQAFKRQGNRKHYTNWRAPKARYHSLQERLES